VKHWLIICVALLVTSCKKNSSNEAPAGGSAVATPTGGSSSIGGKPKRDLATLDVCALLTVAEIEAALGKSKPGSGDKTKCVWQSEAKSPDFEIEVEIEEITKAGLERFEDSLKNAEYYEVITGLGEAASFHKGFKALAIKHNGLIITLQIRSAYMAPEKVDAARVPFGKAIVGRL